MPLLKNDNYDNQKKVHIKIGGSTSNVRKKSKYYHAIDAIVNGIINI